jgi:microcystin-dependent protein
VSAPGSRGLRLLPARNAPVNPFLQAKALVGQASSDLDEVALFQRLLSYLQTQKVSVGELVAGAIIDRGDLQVAGKVKTGASGGSGVATTIVGEIKLYGGAAAPTGWVLCDGTSYLRSQYPALFAVIGTAYGSADASHFNVPNLLGRFPIGAGAGSGLSNRVRGTSGGQETVTLSGNQNGQHTHTLNGHTHAQGAHQHRQSGLIGTGGTGNVAAGGFNGVINNPGTVAVYTGTTGGLGTGTDILTDSGTASAAGTAQNNPPVTLSTPLMNPWTAVTYIIKT